MRGGCSTVIDRKGLLFGVNRDIRAGTLWESEVQESLYRC